MASLAENIHFEIKTSFEKYYLTEIEGQLKREVQQMLRFVTEVQAFHSSVETLREQEIEIAYHKSRLNSIIEKIPFQSDQQEFSFFYKNFSESLQLILEDVDLFQTREQKSERFQILPDDSYQIRTLKFLKKNLFFLSKSPIKFSNFFRKEKIKIHYWKHKIPLRNLAEKHLSNEVVSKLESVTSVFFKSLCAQYLQVKIWEESLGKSPSSEQEVGEGIRLSISDFEKNLLQEIRITTDLALNSSLQTFISDYDKAGTIEYDNSSLNDEAIKRSKQEVEDGWSKNNHNWKNTLLALFEEWKSDLDIHILRHKTLSELSEFKASQIRFLSEQVHPKIELIDTLLKETLEVLDDEINSQKKQLKRLNYEVGKKLDKELVPDLCDVISNQKSNNLINKLELIIKKSVQELSDEYLVVKNDSYSHPLDDDELYKVSLHELIAFEMLEAFQIEIDSIKAELFTSLESIAIGTQDIDHIVTYGLSSAISALEDEGKSEGEAVEIAKEVLIRALARLEETRQSLNGAVDRNSLALEVVVKGFCENILDLTTNDNVRELRLRITRAKTAKQAERVKEQLYERLKYRKKLILSVFKSAYEGTKIIVSEARENFVLTARKPQLTKEVSNFLLESQEVINRLPLVYRRLYRIEPLEDLELFEGRELEQQGFKEAFDNWDKGRFASTAILGEKWGGLTTFLNYVIGNRNFKYPISRLGSKENIYTVEDLLEMLRVFFQQDSFENLRDVIQYLNNGAKRIVILEDLQNLYLRKVGGFEALKAVFQLVTNTNKNVFWVTTTTLYTWSYLSKTIHIDGFFSYIIRMQELRDQQIVDIIWKRNRISGFAIEFEPEEDRLDDKRFRKLDSKIQQETLRREFFSDLNAFAQSNVSLALIFWLLSTKKIDKKSITIGVFQKPDLNFLTALSMDKIYALHALILHDGLKELQLSQVLHSSEITCKLTLLALLEDGILFKENDVYTVNPILYRSTISLLKAKNLIH